MFKYLIIILFISSCSIHRTGKCVLRAGGIDVGSGSTKVIFAIINRCRGTIEKVLFEDQAVLKFKQSLALNNHTIPNALTSQAIKILQQWKKQGDYLRVEQYRGVATEVFRQATNGPHVIKELSQKSHIPIRIITQKDEAIFGFWAGVAKSNRKPEEIVVWDIGGASMQITHYNNREFQSYLGKIASVSFKEKLTDKKTLNPLGPARARQSIARARRLALDDIPETFITAIRKKEAIGVGGVHYDSLKNQMKLKENEPYDQKKLQTTLKVRSLLNDRQIGGEYATTEVTNMALVLGFMQALGMKRVKPVKANLAHGVLLAPPAL